MSVAAACQGAVPNGRPDGPVATTDAPSGPSCAVAVDPTPGRWRTALSPTTGRFGFVAPDGTAAVLRGISMTGIETGTRETASGAGFWLFLSGLAPEATNAPRVLETVVDTLATWHPSVVRIPICGSAWVQNYAVHDFANGPIATYIGGGQTWIHLGGVADPVRLWCAEVQSAAMFATSGALRIRCTDPVLV